MSAAAPAPTILRVGDFLFRWRSYLPLHYACIARREEAFLRERFGPAFLEWAARVPAAVPARWRYVAPACPFRWKAAVR